MNAPRLAAAFVAKQVDGVLAGHESRSGLEKLGKENVALVTARWDRLRVLPLVCPMASLDGLKKLREELRAAARLKK